LTKEKSQKTFIHLCFTMWPVSGKGTLALFVLVSGYVC